MLEIESNIKSLMRKRISPRKAKTPIATGRLQALDVVPKMQIP